MIAADLHRAFPFVGHMTTGTGHTRAGVNPLDTLDPHTINPLLLDAASRGMARTDVLVAIAFRFARTTFAVSR